MNVEAVLARLQGVRRNGTGWMALCPAHADKNASLSIRWENGKVLLKCFAGCAAEAICVSAGIELAELFSDSGASPPQIIAEYAYWMKLTCWSIRFFATNRRDLSSGVPMAGAAGIGI